MSQLIRNFLFLWEYEIAPFWPTIIPLLFLLMAALWVIFIYSKGKFRFLPALAIARVTILDSIGRLEVIILLAIGMLIVGVNGIIPNTAQGQSTLQTWTSMPYIQERLDELSGASSFVPPNPEYNPASESEQSSTYEQDVSVVQDENVINNLGSTIGTEETIQPPDTSPPSTSGENQLSPAEEARAQSTAEELAAQQRQAAMEALISQGAFLEADFFVALIGFVLAMMVLPAEMSRGVILSILPKPISREEYIFGKALGIWIIVAGCFLILTLELFGIQAAFNFVAGRDPVNYKLLLAMALFPFKYATLVLLVMGFTLRMPEVPAGVVGVAFFVTGHFLDRIYEIATSPGINHFMGYALRFAYWMLPHLSQVTFNILQPDASLITNWCELWGWLWQIMIYNLLLLKLLSWLFKRRSL